MNRIRDMRESAGLTQPQLAEILREADPRIDTAMVSRFENEVCVPAEAVMVALERALQAPRTAIYSDYGLAAYPVADKPIKGQNTDSVANAIPFGKRNAISREALCRILGVGDRTMREFIEQARKDGVVILNAQDGKGYYRSDDLQEISAQLVQMENRALSILAQTKPLRDRIIYLNKHQ